uniref:Galectin n=1 Tax=Labrus bergylta TaxID=56723 RepID=A0A3Q3F828_9LABR
MCFLFCLKHLFIYLFQSVFFLFVISLCRNFSINIGHDAENIGMHFNPRFDASGDTNTIVFNSKSGGDWGEECREETSLLCFHINLSMESFYIKLPDGSMLDFPNRLGDIKYKYFSIGGDARIVGIKIK